MRCRIVSAGLKAMVLLFAFVLGVSLTRIIHDTQKARTTVLVGPGHVSNHFDYASWPRVSFCDLKEAPDLYEDKMVLLPIDLRQTGMLRSDEICTKGNANFNLEFVGGGLRESGAEAFWRGGEITLAGRFVKSPFAGAKPRYQFHVFSIFEARLSHSHQ